MKFRNIEEWENKCGANIIFGQMKIPYERWALRQLKEELDLLINKWEEENIKIIEKKFNFPCGICNAKNFEEAGDKCNGSNDCPGTLMSKEIFK